MTHRAGVLLVMLAGFFWSLGGLIVRMMESANAWQILFYRSLTIFLLLLIALSWTQRDGWVVSLYRSGYPALFAGLGIALAFTGFIVALTATSVANAFFLLATQPVLIALVAWPLLGERVDRQTLLAAFATLVGVGIMFIEGFAIGTLYGNAMGLLSALGFTLFTVSLRWGKHADMLPCLLYGSAMTIVTSSIAVLAIGSNLSVSYYDGFLCLTLGVVQIGIGMWIFTIGSKSVPATELGLLAMTEIVLGPIWVWLFLNEAPTAWSLAGGTIVLSSLAWLAALRWRQGARAA